MQGLALERPEVALGWLEGGGKGESDRGGDGKKDSSQVTNREVTKITRQSQL